MSIGTYNDMISREAAEDAVEKELDSLGEEACYKAFRALEHVPSVQPVFEVLRCKDCVYFEDGNPCGIVDYWNTEDDFCSRAERRE